MWPPFKLTNRLQLSFNIFFYGKKLNLFPIELRYWCALKIYIMPFYAVAKGRKLGVYHTWPECKEQIEGIKYAVYKKFETEEEAENFIKKNMGGAKFAPEIVPAYAHQPDPTSNVNTESLFAALESRLVKMECLLTPLIGELMEARNELDTLRTCSFISSTSSSSKRQLSTSEDNYPRTKHHKVSETSSSETIDNADAVGTLQKEYKFDYDSEGFVQVYTDGACEKNGQHSAKAGLGVYFGEEHPLNTSKPVVRRATNNCGEIQAATCAINLARNAGISKLCINTDSQFVINSMTKWLGGWKKKGWKLADGGNVKNKEDFIELDAAAKHVTIKWNYVKAHCGILGNERADELAKQGAAQYETRRQW